MWVIRRRLHIDKIHKNKMYSYSIGNVLIQKDCLLYWAMNVPFMIAKSYRALFKAFSKR